MNKIAEITLNCGLKEDLEWKNEKEQAIIEIEKGNKLFWELDLGLFANLKFPLGNGTQFLSLKLSVQHFVEKIWEMHKSESRGVILYRGPLEHSLGFPWDQEQEKNLQGWLADHFETIETFYKETGLSIESFSTADSNMLEANRTLQHIKNLFCRDAIGEYLSMLGRALPEAIPAYIVLETGEVADPLYRSLYSAKDCFSQFEVIEAKDARPLPPLGVLFPDASDILPSLFYDLHQALLEIKQMNKDYRTIPASFLTTEWHALDHLIVDPKIVDSQSFRMLQGYCAAGGGVVSLGNTIGVSNEITFSKWKDMLT